MPHTLSTMIRFILLDPKKILVSNYPLEKIQKKYPSRFEILTSIKDMSVVDILKTRLTRQYPSADFIDWFIKPKKPISEETRKLLSLRKLGKPRPDWVRKKISKSKKGISQFQGKKHTEETKRVMASKKLGNQHVKDLIWAHDPRGSKELRVRTLRDIPEGFSKGRDFDIAEILRYNAKYLNNNL